MYSGRSRTIATFAYLKGNQLPILVLALLFTYIHRKQKLKSCEVLYWLIKH